MALATNSAAGEVILAGDIHGSDDPYAPELTPTGVSPGQYILPDIVVDAKGRLLYARDGELELPCASDTEVGGVKPGRHIVFDDDTFEISIPNASTTTYGVVELGTGFVVDGTSIAIDWDIATASTLGVVKVPTANGLSVDGAGSIAVALTTENSFGTMQVGTGLDVSAGVVSVDVTELDATTSSKGFVQVGTNIDVSSGVISVPDATTGSKGVVQVGTGLDVSAGVVSLNTGTLDDATESSKGVIQVGTGLDVSAGVVSVDLTEVTVPDATTSSKGWVQVGTNLSVASGVLSITDADSTTTKGIIKSANASNISISSGNIDVGSNIAKKDASNTYTKPCISSIDTLTGTSVTPDFAESDVFTQTLTGTTTYNAPSNASDGQQVIFIIKQDGTGSRTITFDSVYKFMETPVLTTAANAIDIVSCIRLSSTEYLCQLTTNYS